MFSSIQKFSYTDISLVAKQNAIPKALINYNIISYKLARSPLKKYS
jgi:hypothetical protein